MKQIILAAALMIFSNIQAKVVYVATNGSDEAIGTIESPMATLPAAYKKISSGDTICFRGGTYSITDDQVMKKDNTYACMSSHLKRPVEPQQGHASWAIQANAPCSISLPCNSTVSTASRHSISEPATSISAISIS